MSHGVQLQAVPENWAVLQGVVDGQFHHDDIQTSFHLYAYMRRGYRAEAYYSQQHNDPDYVAVCERALALMKQEPHLLNVYCDLSSTYQFAIYGLKQVASSDREHELAKIAVMGAKRMTETANGSQGFPLNWTTASEAIEVSDFLARFEREEIASSVEAAGPPKPSLYKQVQFCDDERWPHIVGNKFSMLKKFYKAACASKMAVIALGD